MFLSLFWHKSLISPGALIYLLDLFCNATNPTVRERSAELFSKMMSDKLIGPKVKIVLSKFLPPIFMDAMRDNAEASVHMYEGEDWLSGDHLGSRGHFLERAAVIFILTFIVIPLGVVTILTLSIPSS